MLFHVKVCHVVICLIIAFGGHNACDNVAFCWQPSELSVGGRDRVCRCRGR